MTGTTTSEYVVQFGRQSYLDKSLEILQHILKKHSTNCVIAISAKMSDIPACRTELQEFATTHPLVHIIRKAEYIVEHLNNHMSRDDILILYLRCIAQYRALCNYEFYNGGGAELAGLPSHDTSPMASFLSLKHAQRDLLGFISRIRGSSRLHTFMRAPEDTEFSRVLLLPFPQHDNHDDSPDPRTIHGIHLIQLQLSLPRDLEADFTSLLDRLSFVLARFRRNCDYPVALRILPLPTPADRSTSEHPHYFRVLQHGVSLAFDYCYVDLGVSHHTLAQFTRHAGATKIGTWHDYGQASAQSSLWEARRYQAIFDLAVDIGCCAVQPSAPAATMQDNYDVMKFAEKMRQMGALTRLQISAFNTGEIGRLSRIMNRTLSPVVDSHFLAHIHCDEEQTFHGRLAELAGIITVEESRKALEGAFIVRKLRFCSFGSLISHSIAPAMHNAALSALGLPYQYGLVQSADVTKSLHLMRAHDFGGLRCANPHKRGIIGHLDHISDAARDIIAVNTVYTVLSPAGGRPMLVGENTDWIGVTSCIENYLSPINTITSKTTALVLGAGGMAHAAVYALLRLGVTRILLWNRTLSRAEALKKHFQQVSKSLQRYRSSSDLEDDVLNNHEPTDDAQDSGPVVILPSTEPSQISNRGLAYPSLIINTLADGADQPVASAFDLAPDWFSNEIGGVYVESAYRSLDSVLRSKVHALISRNWIAVRGQELLLEQAFPQIGLWTGMLAPREVMRSAVNL